MEKKKKRVINLIQYKIFGISESKSYKDWISGGTAFLSSVFTQSVNITCTMIETTEEKGLVYDLYF